MLKFGVVGIGIMGSKYCTWLEEGKIPGGMLAAVCDISEERRAWAETHLSREVVLYSDYRAMIDSGKLDAVLVVTPHYLHPTIAIYALEHGLHVIVDKPAGVYAKQVREMNAVAAAHPELKFAMMFNQRTHPLYKNLKTIIDAGEIGDIRHVNWLSTIWWRTQKYYDSSSWRATWSGEGGGILANQAPHQLDMLQWLCGMPVTMRGFLKYGSHRNIPVEDDVSAYFEFANGATGTYVACTHDAVGSDRLDIHGSQGKIIIENGTFARIRRMFQPEEYYNQHYTFQQTRAIVKGLTEEKICSEEIISCPENWDAQHIDIVVNLIEAVEHGVPLIAPGEEGLRSIEIANAMYLSSWLNHDVQIPVDPELYYEKLMEKVSEENRRTLEHCQNN